MTHCVSAADLFVLPFAIKGWSGALWRKIPETLKTNSRHDFTRVGDRAEESDVAELISNVDFTERDSFTMSDESVSTAATETQM